MAFDFMRLNGFKTYRGLLALLMLMAITMGNLAHAKTTEISHPASLEDIATIDHSHEHGHSHDIEGPKDQTFNHSHEHNPADHSHDIPGISTILGQAPLYSFSNQRSISAASQVNRVSFTIDRPPRF